MTVDYDCSLHSSLQYIRKLLQFFSKGMEEQMFCWFSLLDGIKGPKVKLICEKKVY